MLSTTISLPCIFKETDVRMVMWFAQIFTDSKWQSQNASPKSLSQNPCEPLLLCTASWGSVIAQKSVVDFTMAQGRTFQTPPYGHAILLRIVQKLCYCKSNISDMSSCFSIPYALSSVLPNLKLVQVMKWHVFRKFIFPNSCWNLPEIMLGN